MRGLQQTETHEDHAHTQKSINSQVANACSPVQGRLQIPASPTRAPSMKGKCLLHTRGCTDFPQHLQRPRIKQSSATVSGSPSRPSASSPGSCQMLTRLSNPTVHALKKFYMLCVLLDLRVRIGRRICRSHCPLGFTSYARSTDELLLRMVQPFLPNSHLHNGISFTPLLRICSANCSHEIREPRVVSHERHGLSRILLLLFLISNPSLEVGIIAIKSIEVCENFLRWQTVNVKTPSVPLYPSSMLPCEAQETCPSSISVHQLCLLVPHIFRVLPDFLQINKKGNSTLATLHAFRVS